MVKIYNAILSSIAVGMFAFSAPATVYAADSQAITLEVSDVTKRDVHVKVLPADETQNYAWGVVTSALVERAGGLIGLYQYHDRSWWEFLAQTYDLSSWKDAAAMDENRGPVEGTFSELMEDVLVWDTDYVLYAYTLDKDYEPSSEVYAVEFHTLPANKSDITFDVSLVQVVADENNPSYNKATIRIVPSNEDTYATHVHEAKFWDFYDGNDQFTFQDYLDNQVYPFISKIRSGEQELTFANVNPKQEYIIATLGYDETPTTEGAHLFRFSGAVTGIEAVDAEAVTITGAKGAVDVYGDYDMMTIYATDGRVAGVYRGTRHIELPSGIYIVKIQAAGNESTAKVLVR